LSLPRFRGLLLVHLRVRSRPRRRYIVTTQSRHKHPIAPNLVARQFEVTSPNQIWVSDLTDLRTLTGFAYLAVVLDLYSRRVVGWKVSQDVDAGVVLQALRRALAVRPTPAGMIHHGDRGVHYACGDYRKMLDARGITSSMSRKGDCWDNAVAESFFATLFFELERDARWYDVDDVDRDLVAYIDHFYNPTTRHHTIAISAPLTSSAASVKKRMRRNPGVHETGSSPLRRAFGSAYHDSIQWDEGPPEHPGGSRAVQRHQGVRGRIRRTRRELQQVGGPMGDKSSPMFSWCRCAAIFAIVCSIAACVPPNPAWSSPDPAGQSAEPEESARTYENEGDGVAEDDDAEDAPSTAADRDQSGSTTARSHAPPGKTCAAACRRFSDCKLFSFEPCMEECGKQGAEGTAEGRRTNLVQARSSCNSLAAGMAPSDWVCIAEGESVYGYDVESATGDVQGTSSVHIAGQAKTRDDAQYSAISNCHSMMTVDLNRNGSMNMEPSPQGSWGSAISSPCHITQCHAPARARRGKSSSR
jgi:hypothetical protein